MIRVHAEAVKIQTVLWTQAGIEGSVKNRYGRGKRLPNIKIV